MKDVKMAKTMTDVTKRLIHFMEEKNSLCIEHFGIPLYGVDDFLVIYNLSSGEKKIMANGLKYTLKRLEFKEKFDRNSSLKAISDSEFCPQCMFSRYTRVFGYTNPPACKYCYLKEFCDTDSNKDRGWGAISNKADYYPPVNNLTGAKNLMNLIKWTF